MLKPGYNIRAIAVRRRQGDASDRVFPGRTSCNRV
jgi:hypothetical protein